MGPERYRCEPRTRSEWDEVSEMFALFRRWLAGPPAAENSELSGRSSNLVRDKCKESRLRK